jgi:hypothetical protein
MPANGTPATLTEFQVNVISGNPLLGSGTADAVGFFYGAPQTAPNMVVGQTYTIVTLGNTTFSSYASLVSGTANTVGAVILCTSVPASGQTGTVFPQPLLQTSAILTNTALYPLPATCYSGLTSSTPFGFSTLANAQALVAQVQAITSALVALGLMVG